MDIAHEEARLAAVARLRLLDTLPERIYDDLAQVARSLAGTAFAAITLIDRDRQFLKARIGFEATETPRSTAICDTAIRQPDQVLEVEDARADPRFAEFATVVGEPYIRLYAGAPLLSRDGHALGTLCVFDPAPGRLSDDQRLGLQALARQVMHLFELRARNRELRLALSSQRERQQELAQTQRELVSANLQLLREARQDPLSGLMNRRGLDELEQRVDEGGFPRHLEYTVLVLDVDHFKAINDGHGHAVGDEVIRALGAIIGSSVRGEEFGVVMPGAGTEAAQRVAERVRARCASGEETPLAFRLSGGIASGRVGEGPLSEVLERADRALYRAKRGGRDRVELATAGD